MRKAKLLIDHLPKARGHQALYELSEPLDGHSLVVVSAIDYESHGWKTLETYIFPASKDGEIIDYCELEGSIKGTASHAEALANAGYEIAP
ncbi:MULTISPECIES: hypothetical protein [Pseudomonas]|uniref:Uncharacterized protein n=1 Tax=Pseudomonas lutea TaxID=243924 RepID=A0A9X8MHU2_9PSED|nr:MULTISPECIES: hypothetical protein [Pseudomonas]SER51203.1 hypothetical protein SAMN05216409_1327 [Pseudomonas lutea]